MPLKLIKNKNLGNFVCTWCAARFKMRSTLNEHLFNNPSCRENRTVSNPLQSKYLPANNAKTVAGEEILRKIRSRDCTHTNTQNILNADQELIAIQCTWCYTYLEAPQGGD